MSEDIVLPYPNLDLPQCAFILSQPSLPHLHEKARTDLLAGIQEDRMPSRFERFKMFSKCFLVEMASYYCHLTSTSEPSTSTQPPSTTTAPLPFDSKLYDEMSAKNKIELDRFDNRLAEAEKTEGESDVADLLRGRAMYLVRIGDKVRFTFPLSHVDS